MIQEVDGMMVEGNATKFCGIALKLDGGDTVQLELNDDKSGNFFLELFPVCCDYHQFLKFMFSKSPIMFEVYTSKAEPA